MSTHSSDYFKADNITVVASGSNIPYMTSWGSFKTKNIYFKLAKKLIYLNVSKLKMIDQKIDYTMYFC